MKGKDLTNPKIDDFVNKTLIDYNSRLYPNPEFIGLSEILVFYGKLLNWRKVGVWAEKNLVRKQETKYLANTNNTLYNDKNPEHIVKGWRIGYHYAKEDFEILIEKEKILKNNKIKIKNIVTENSVVGIYRNYQKQLPDLKEIENLADSYNTFICYLAKKKLENELSKQKFTPEEVIKFGNFIDCLVPLTED